MKSFHSRWDAFASRKLFVTKLNEPQIAEFVFAVLIYFCKYITSGPQLRLNRVNFCSVETGARAKSEIAGKGEKVSIR